MEFEKLRMSRDESQIPLSDIGAITESILKTKMEIFNQEIKDSFQRLKLSINLGN